MAFREEYCRRCWNRHYIECELEDKSTIETEECVLCKHCFDDSNDLIDMMIDNMDGAPIFYLTDLIRILWIRIKHAE